MYATTPNTITLAGAFGEPEARSLIKYCAMLAQSGQRHIVIDVHGVVDCRRAGLAAMMDLSAGGAGLDAVVRGARWSQFMVLLGEADVGSAPLLCDDIRTLVETTPASSRTGSGR